MKNPPNNWMEKKATRKSTFGQITGSFMERKTKHPILLCECGNRYLKTRLRQKVCLRCVSQSMV